MYVPFICLCGQELPEGAVRLSSKHGQQYQCSYPDKVTKEKQEEKEKIAMETGIPELLKPMFTICKYTLTYDYIYAINEH